MLAECVRVAGRMSSVLDLPTLSTVLAGDE